MKNANNICHDFISLSKKNLYCLLHSKLNLAVPPQDYIFIHILYYQILNKIFIVHRESKGVSGESEASLRRVAMTMIINGIRPITVKKCKATINSKHNYSVTENLLNQCFTADKSNEKWVCDIIYIWTEEG